MNENPSELSVNERLIKDVLENQGRYSWREYKERNGYQFDHNSAKNAWARFAKKHGLPKELRRDGEFAPIPKASFPYDFSRLELRATKLNKDGEVISQQLGKRLTPDELPDFSGFELQAATTNPNGGAWLKYKVNSLGFDPQELKSILADVGATDFAKKEWIEQPVKSELAQIISIGDIHIGMDSEDNVFNHKWNKDKAIQRAKMVANFVRKDAGKIVLIIGGDLADGLNGKTTRGGHNLPQNLSSKEQIRQSAIFCLAVLDTVTDETPASVEVVFITDSNHGGGVMDFAVGLILESSIPHRYSGQVSFMLQETFVGTYKVGELDFIVTHGYDEKHMPKGLPRFLQKEQITFFERVIEHHKLQNPVILRYDQHQYHDIQYPKFRDIMTKAFCTPSSWVSLNFAANDAGGFLSALVSGNRLSVEPIDF